MKGIRHKVETACATMKCTAQQFFIQAFKATFGKNRRGIVREARSAHGRWKNKGSLTARARKAISAFLAGILHSTAALAAA